MKLAVVLCLRTFPLCNGLSGIAQILSEGYKIPNDDLSWSQATEIAEYGIQKDHTQGILWPYGIRNGEMLRAYDRIGQDWQFLSESLRSKKHILSNNCHVQ